MGLCSKKCFFISIFVVILVAVGITLGVTLSNRTKKTPEPEFQFLRFPDEFKLGTASCAYQIEGAWNLDGKGPSIWDTFTHDQPDRIDDRKNGDDAQLSYYLYKEDVRILKEMNAQFYRFSISWSRVLPTGQIASRNQLGIDYYHNVIDELIANGIEPMITMYIWDLPQALEDLGGFQNPMIIERFEEYADLLFEEYGGKVKQWLTFNEPADFCANGYSEGTWAPGVQLVGVGDYICGYHSILAHARAYHLYQDKYFATQQGRVGIILSIGYNFPEDPTDATHIAARDRDIEFWFGMFAHPIIWGDYPAIVRERVDRNSAEEGRPSSRLPTLTAPEIDYIRGSSDFFGLNYYTSRIIRPATEDNFPNPSMMRDVFVDTWVDESWPRAKSDWLYSEPEGLYQALMWIKEKYNNVEIFVTENGWSDDGQLEDPERIEFLNGHLHAILRAVEDGCKVTGHATWSIMDNFEWLRGYTERFGVYFVDNDDPERKRVAKDSAKYLSQLFANRVLSVRINESCSDC